MGIKLSSLCALFVLGGGCAMSHEAANGVGGASDSLNERFVGEWALETQWTTTLYEFSADGQARAIAERGCVYCDSYRYSANVFIPAGSPDRKGDRWCEFGDEWWSDDGVQLALSGECRTCTWSDTAGSSCETRDIGIELTFPEDASGNSVDPQIAVLNPSGWTSVARWRKCAATDAECDQIRECSEDGECVRFDNEL